MADGYISQVHLPNDTTYDLKVRADNVFPIISKSYPAYTCSANNEAKGVLYFGKVTITNSSPWQTPWSIHYRLYVTTTEANTQGWYDCFFSVSGSTINYYNYNNFYSTDYRPIYHHRLIYPKNNYSSYGAYFGVRVQSARLPDSLARTFTIEILETKNCTVTLNDNIKRFDEIYVTTNNIAASTIWYNSEYNATSVGLQEQGDANTNDTGYYIITNGFRGTAGTNKIYPYTLFGRISDGSYESFVMSNSTGNSKTKNPHGFIPDGKIYYNSGSSTYSAGALSFSPYEQYHVVDYRYSFNLTRDLVPNYCEIFVRYTYNSEDGLLYLADNWYSNALPTAADGFIYQKIGGKYYNSGNNATTYWYQGSLLLENPYYEYKNGAIHEWNGNAVHADTAPLSGISGADDLKAIEALTGTSGLLKKTAANTWTLDTNSYVTSSGITSVTISATSPVQSSTSTAQTGSSASTTISLKDAYGDTKNPYGTKTANYILAGPTSGDAAAPSFRAMVEADLPYTYFRNRGISPATDLSAYTTPGSYFNATGNNTGANANTGFKHGHGYILAFGKTSDTYEGVQVEINYLGTDIWYRTKYGNDWYNKYQILTSANTITAAQGGTGQSTYTIGDILYASAATTLSKLSGNTTKTRKFLRSVATTEGTAVAPAWDTITKTDVGLGNVENTKLSTWTGSSNISTVGTITSGTWQGTAIAAAYIGDHSTDKLTSGTLANARLPARLQEYHTTVNNNTTISGWYYGNSDSPFTKYHTGNADFMVWTHGYSSIWASELATDFRTNRFAVRNLNNGTWNSWRELAGNNDIANEFIWSSDIYYDSINNRFTNTRGTNSWASQIYSKHGFADGCYVSFRVEDTTHYRMIGLNSDPTNNANYNTIDYAWYPQQGGGLNIYENGTSVSSISGHTTYAAGDDFRIEYNNGQIRYYHNGICCRTVERAISGQLYLDSSFYNAGTIVDLRFGPLSNIGIIQIEHGGTGISSTSPHYALLGPSSGTTTSAPTWRAITASDLPVATSDTQGIVQIGSGITVNNGTISVTASNLGLSNALHFIGITSTELTNGSTTSTLTAKSEGSLSKTTGFVDGDVVMDGDQLREYVWSGSAWRLLGITTSTTYTQPTTTANNTWISQISQGTDGKITATTGSLVTTGTWSGKAGSLTDIGNNDAASSTNTWRRVWFSYNDNATGRPAYSDKFVFQTSTNTLKIDTGTLTATQYSGNAATATTAGGITTAGTTGQFWRGDNSWSNTIKQTAAAALGIDSNKKIGTAIKDLHFSLGSGSGTDSNSGNGGGITFGTDTASYGGIYWQTSGSYGSRLHFATTNAFANGAYTRMIILPGGNVGIGLVNPQTLFQVSGTSTLQHIYTQTDATYDIGATATRWRSAYLTTSLLVGAKNTITAYNSNALGSFVGPGVFSSCVTAAGDGYYLFGKAVQYGRLYIDAIGIAGTNTTTYTNPNDSSQTKAGYSGVVLGKAYLILGNNKAVGYNGSSYNSPGSPGTADNAQGFLRLFSDNTGSADLTAYTGGDKTRIYPVEGFAIPHDKIGIMFRPSSSAYYTHFSYETAGNEALVMATQNAVTSFIFVNGESYANVSASRWQNLDGSGASGKGNAPGLQIKKNCVSIGKLITNGTDPSYKLEVKGDTYIKGLIYLDGKTYIGSQASTYAMPTDGLNIWDTRGADFAPNKIPKGVNFFFTNTPTPTTNWCSGIYVHGWDSSNYAAWCLVGPAESGDYSTTPLYVRTSKNASTWGSYRKIYDTSNPPTYSEVGAPKTDGTDATGTWGISITGTASYTNTTENTSDTLYPVGVISGVTSTLKHDTSIQMKGGEINVSSGYKIGTKGAVWHNGTNLWIGATATDENVFTGKLYLNGGLTGTKRNRVAYISLGASDTATTGTNYPIVHKDAAGGVNAPIYVDANGKTVACTTYANASVNYANSAGAVAWENVSSKPTSIALTGAVTATATTLGSGAISITTTVNHGHGNITSDGKIGSAGKKKLVIVGTDNKVTTGAEMDTSTTNQWLNKKGEWSTPTAAQVGAAPSSHTHPVSDLTWDGGVNLKPTATANNQEWSIDLTPGSYTGTYWHVYSATQSATILGCYTDDGHVTMPSNIASTSTNTGTLQVTGGIGATGQVTALRLAANGSNTSYSLYVNGTSYLNSTTTINGDLNFAHTGSSTNGYITWSSGSWYQRIYVKDDSTNDTAVFTFQQSSDTGSSYSDLFTIKDNGSIVVGSRVTSTAPSSETSVNRIIITPYYHTGGPWKITSSDNSSNAFLKLFYGSSELLKIKNDGTFISDLKASITGNAATATSAGKATNDSDGNAINTTYLKKSGGQMTGPLTWKDSTALPESTSTSYMLALDAFASGGTTKWITTENVRTSISAVKKVTSTDNAIVRFDGTGGEVQNSTATINDKGTMTINGRLVLNPKKDDSTQSYNEGIRINQSTNGWANIQFGGADESTSGTEDGQWLAGRRGAAGSKVGAIGDFSIEEQNSIGGGLTIHKDNGGVTFYSKLAYNKPQLEIWNDNSISGGKFGQVISAVSTMAATANSIILIGAANSSKNQAYLGFHYEGSGLDTNYLTLGLHSADHLLKIFPTGQVNISTNITSSSTSTGSLVVAGGTGIAGALYVGGNTAVGTTTAGSLGLAQTNGTGLGISLYGGPKATGALEYGIMFAKTATFGTCGSVTGTWATYFTMNRDDTRGWIFKSNDGAANGNNNVTSIAANGNIYTIGNITVGSNVTLQWNSTDSSLDFIFA